MSVRALSISFLVTLTHLLTTLGPSAFGEELPVPTATSVAPANPRSIQVDIRLVEISVGKMRELGFDYSTVTEQAGVRATEGQVLGIARGKQYDPRQINRIIDARRQNELADVLAEPRLVTLDGRPATIEINSEVATEHRFGKPSQKKMTGMRVDVMPKLIEENRCRMELRLDWSGIVRDRSDVARLRKHRIDTAFATEAGKTMVVSTARAKDNHSQYDQTLLVLVTPTIVDTTQPDDRTAHRTTER